MNKSERRARILEYLRAAGQPLSATALAQKLSVSRQIIVGDVALLRAAGNGITATPRGYVLDRPRAGIVYTAACLHRPEDMERELTLVVDQGCTVENVVVEHPVYGQLAAPLGLSSRRDVAEFMRRIGENSAQPLSALTGGVHLHALRCPDRETLDRVVAALDGAGFLVR